MQDTEKILQEIKKAEKWDENSLTKILRKFPKDGRFMYKKDDLVKTYAQSGEKDELIEKRIRMKPTRTNSGVVTVTVLTKPFPCPGQCIYCPNDPLMPKSYISSEPGAQRALKNKFDPYAQVFNRLMALKNIGHNIEKVELIILGGTWSHYVQDYQISFIYECYRALNDIKKTTTGHIKPRSKIEENISWTDLRKVHQQNELAFCRNVGLVLETRPDFIDEEEVKRMRRLGATKVQIGIQSTSDRILKKNEIGRKNKDTITAFKLLRRMGFKIHGHWMPNLFGSNFTKDIKDYKNLWTRKYSPDELKIYPTSVIPNTKLFDIFSEKKYNPYSEKELTQLLKKILPLTPRYCRLTRIIRDIPSNEIAAGSKRTNLRQIVEKELQIEGIETQDIRSREIKDNHVEFKDLDLEIKKYPTSVSNEIFLSYKTKVDDKICGFLRLSLPKRKYKNNHFVNELEGCSIIREVHVYGNVLGIDKKSKGDSQHLGLGKSLISLGEGISRERGFNKIAVISAIGTKDYYRNRGFKDGELFMQKDLSI